MRRPFGPGPLLALLAIVLLSFSIAACGQAGNRAHATSSAAASSASYSVSPGTLASIYRAHASAQTLLVPARDQPPLANDGDNEQPGDEDGDNGHDVDSDSYADYQPIPDNRVYHDADDSADLAFGQAASARDTHTVADLVKRYYAAGLAGDGRRACSMLQAGLARAVPVDYGRFGPSYLRGGKTCVAVLSLLFKREHRQIQVTEVRVSGDGGLAFFGSKTTPASDISVKREHHSWKIAQLLGAPLT